MKYIRNLELEKEEKMAKEIITKKESFTKRKLLNEDEVVKLFLLEVAVFIIVLFSYIFISKYKGKEIDDIEMVIVSIFSLLPLFIISIGISATMNAITNNKSYSKFKKDLENDREYQVAKEIMEKYHKKNYKYLEEQKQEFNKNQLNNIFEEEIKKSNRIQEMEIFLKKEK